MQMKILIAAGIIMLAIVRVPEAQGCSCSGAGVIDSFNNSDVIFEGQVKSIQIPTRYSKA
jgi:hypothetical protein